MASCDLVAKELMALVGDTIVVTVVEATVVECNLMMFRSSVNGAEMMLKLVFDCIIEVFCRPVAGSEMTIAGETVVVAVTVVVLEHEVIDGAS